MAPAGGRTTHLLLLALLLSFVLASSADGSYPEHPSPGAGGFFSGIPWFRGGQPSGARATMGKMAGEVVAAVGAASTAPAARPTADPTNQPTYGGGDG
ncbi:unnamed protein product [Triticum turgidum subsp. durum]|uniref:Uncharacterized protein n=1 Tax=Triticum turgidum subsp. durum TaxID=4567 RepID=A0A9R1R7M0_TRITD|nr:unnamed protein product [Triticum turgidum subsp. durum]